MHHARQSRCGLPGDGSAGTPESAGHGADVVGFVAHQPWRNAAITVQRDDE
jgi:hypothetical protein